MICIQNLSFSYWPGTEREISVLKNVSLGLKNGKWGVLIGPSGSGKSTLLFLLAGFLSPFKGRIKIDGDFLTSRSLPIIREKIGLVLQFPENQLFAPNVFEEVGYGLKMRKFPKEERELKTVQSIAKAGLNFDDVRLRSPFQLSLGEKRRLALASVLALEPRVLLLDEPTAGLDPKGRKELLNLLAGLKKEGVTILQVTHHLEEVLPFADQAFFLMNGELLLESSLASLISLEGKETERIKAFLPQSVLRLQKLKEKFPSFSPRTFSLEEISCEMERLVGGKG